jgi:hypothetical protein
MTPFSLNTLVSYTRHCDGTTVTGHIRNVYDAHDAPSGVGVMGMFDTASLKGERWAYRLELGEEDAARVGHPVTVGHSRVRLVDA